MNGKKNNKAWLVFIGCCILSLVGFGMVVNTPGLYFTSISEELSVSRAEIALTLTISAVTQALTLLVAGKIFSKIDTRILLSICIFIFGGGFITVSFVHSMIPFYIIYALIGIAQAIALVLAIPVLLGNWFKEKLGSVMGIALGISGIGGAIFNQMVSQLIIHFGWRTSYKISGIFLLICLLPFTLLVFKYKPNPEKGEYPYGEKDADIESKKPQKEDGISAKRAYKTPSFILYVVAIILLQMVAGMVQHVSSHVVNLGFELSVGASVVSGIMLGAAVGKASIGILLDKINGKAVILLFAALGALGWGGLMLAGVSVVLIFCGFISGVGQGLLLVGLPWFVRHTFGNKEYSQIYSIISMFGAFASAVASSLNGIIFDVTGGYTASLIMNVVFYVIAAVCVITAYKRKVQPENI